MLVNDGLRRGGGLSFWDGLKTRNPRNSRDMEIENLVLHVPRTGYHGRDKGTYPRRNHPTPFDTIEIDLTIYPRKKDGLQYNQRVKERSK
jgi:hypothetical protein